MTTLANPPRAQANAGKPAGGSLLGDHDLYLFNEGTHSKLYEKLGAHLLPGGGVYFAVWAPNAQYVSVIGDFNDWDKGRHPLRVRGSSGIWEIAVPEAKEGSHYKFHIASRFNGHFADKAVPFGFRHGVPPLQESIVARLDYEGHDGDWMRSREKTQKLDKPMSIYEMHLGSWMRVPEHENRWLSYR